MSDLKNEPSAIDNADAYLDSRNIQERIDWLDKIDNPEADHVFEQKTLLKLKSDYVDMYGESSWDFGAQFIRDGDFEDYARDLADDIGAISNDMSWPNTFIDWEAAADALKMDYSEIDFDGVSYWTREA